MKKELMQRDAATHGRKTDLIQRSWTESRWGRSQSMAACHPSVIISTWTQNFRILAARL